MSSIKDLMMAIKDASTEKTRAYDTTATVTRIEGNTAWVHIPGGVNETPAKMTINAKVGEAVQVRVSDGKAFLIGNASAPPTNDARANEVLSIAQPSVDFVQSLMDKDVSVSSITSSVGYIDDLYSKNITTENIEAATGYIGDLNADNISAQNIIADHETVGSLDAHYAHISNGVIDNAKIGYADVDDLDAHYAEIDLANVNNAWIEYGAIKKAEVFDENVFDLSGDHATLSKIDASKINVANLRADNLVVRRINGQPVVGGYTLIDSNSSGYASKNPQALGWYEFVNAQWVLSTDTTVDMTKAYYQTGNEVSLYDQAYIDGLEDDLQQQIDGAVETFTGSVVPTLTNYPYNEWYDTSVTPVHDERAKHVGDIYYVVNSASDENGYCYRFAYDNTSHAYSWVLIKDSDVTKALSDISELQTFESTTTSWMDETDEGLETIRTNHTALAGVVDKTVKESVQLWFTKANTTAPNKPTAEVTSTSTSGNAWRKVVPAWNASYPNYYYCWQYKFVDGTFDWSAVVRDIAMGETQGTARDAQTTANSNIKSSVQLWFTKANTTAPSKPTAQVTNSNATGSDSYNKWNLVVPIYNSSYPYYYYCYQQQKGDGTYQWSDVVYDQATSDSMKTAKEALPASTFTSFESTTFKDVKDTVTEHSTKFTNMTSRLGLNSDGTGANTDIVAKESALEQTVDGISTRVGKTETKLIGMYATSSTAEDTRDKVATITPALPSDAPWELSTGTMVTVKFVNANTYEATSSSPLRLNVNGKGLKPIKTYANGNLSKAEYKWAAGSTFTFVYNGTNWLMQDSSVSVRMNSNETSISQTADSIISLASGNTTYTKPDGTTVTSAIGTTVNQTANNVLIKATRTGATPAEQQAGGTSAAALINVTPDTVKIAANHVEIDGTAVFNAVSDSSTASAAMLNSELEIGGRNLLRNSGTYDGWLKNDGVTSDGNILDINVSGATSNLFRRAAGSLAKTFNELNGETCVVSFEVYCDDWSVVEAGTGIVGALAAQMSLVTFNATNDMPVTGYTLCRYRYGHLTDDTLWNQPASYANGEWIKITSKPFSVPEVFTSTDVTTEYGTYVGVTPQLRRNGHVKFRNIKWEIGNKATDWTPAPEDVQAEIDAKKSIHTLATNLSYTYANILTYSAEGYSKSGGWAVTDASGVRVGDTARLKVTASDMGTGGTAVYVVGTVTAVSGNTITMTSHGLDTTVIDGGHILTGTIDANNVNISNLTVGTFTEAEQNKVLNSNIQIGGKNLLRNSANMGTGWAMENGTNSNGIVTLTRTNAETRVYQLPANGYWTWKAGQTYVASVEAKGNAGGETLQMIANAGSPTYHDTTSTLTTSWKRYYRSFTITADASTGSMHFANTTNNSTIQVRYPKLEIGNKATDWTPAPEDAVNDNLLIESQKMSAWRLGGSASRDTTDDFGVITLTGSSSNWNATTDYMPTLRTSILDGTPLWLSFEYKASTAITSMNLILAGTALAEGSYFTSSQRTKYSNNMLSSLPAASSWTRKAVAMPTSLSELVSGSGNVNSIYVQFYNRTNNSTVQIRKVKLEHGFSATDWTSSSEDQKAYITRIDDAGIRIHPSSTENDSLLITASGVNVYKGGTSVAYYGDTARIGKTANEHVEIGSSAMSYYNGATRYARFGGWTQLGTDSAVHLKASADGLEFAGANGRNVFDVHLSGTNSNRYISERFNSTSAALAGVPVTGTEIYARFADSTTSAHTLYVFTAGTNGTFTYNKGSSNYTATYTASTQTITMSGSNSPKVVRVSYTTAFPNLYTTIGTRSFGDDETDSATAGMFSLAQGLQCYASGEASTALNYGTKAAGNYQTAIGKWNAEDATSLFIIGKGSSANSRANAFSVGSNGTVYVNGTSVHSSDRRLKEHISYLGDEAVEFIDGLKPAHYIKDGKKHVGFYAQDVKDVDKWDCMLGEEMNGYMTLSYMDLIAPLVTYCQKLEERINKLESEDSNE